MSKHLTRTQNCSKIRQIECECSRREKQRRKHSAMNSSEIRFLLEGVCCPCDYKCLDYFVITLKIDQLQAYKNS